VKKKSFITLISGHLSKLQIWTPSSVSMLYAVSIAFQKVTIKLRAHQ